jgi:hypothetical protein
MKPSRTKNIVSFVTALCVLFQVQVAFATGIRLPANTRIYVETTQELIGKRGQAEQGQSVRAKVWRDVVVNGHVLIAAGAPVMAKVDEVKHRNIAGVKGKMTVGAYETESVDGQAIQLSGGYHKDGKSRMALSITLGVLFILPIFIPGKAAELPAGTVFDASVDNNWQVEVGATAGTRKINLSYMDSEISAELLYEKFEGQEKPKYFEFQISVPQDTSTTFVIDRVNSEAIDPLKLKNISENIEDGELVVNAQIKIKKLLKKFVKGINTIEIASIEGNERIATKLIIDIEI